MWEAVKDVAVRKQTKLYGREGYYVQPVPTADFFRLTSDDMIPYWEENGDFELSEELWDWFKDLKEAFDAVTEEELEIAEPLDYIMGLIEEAERNYQIYSFAEFFEETLEHLQEKRYLQLWKLYEELLRAQEQKLVGKVMLVPERNNMTGRMFRRYMALVANRKLREKVFGF